MRNLPKPLLVAVLMSCAVACGDDDDGKAGGGAGTDLRDAAVPDGGLAGPSGPGAEGWLCLAQSECNAPLKCVGSNFSVSSGGVTRPVGVCGRACAASDECTGKNEICYSYTGKDADQHCIDQVTEEYGVCGIADTSICKDRSCLYAPDAPIGVCVDICSLDGEVTRADGGVDDGGVIIDPSVGFAMCRADEACIDDILAKAENHEGVCGVEVARGELCSVVRGQYCKEGDVCAPEDPAADATDWRCYQDCSSGNDCDDGRCTVIQNLIAYCL